MADEHPLRVMWEAAGFPTAAAFARASGLRPSDLSRIVSPSSGRRATTRQVRAIAAALDRPFVDIAKVVLPAQDEDLQTFGEVAAERDKVIQELGAARRDNVEKDAALAGRGEQIRELTLALGTLHRDFETAREELAKCSALRGSQQVELASLRRELAARTEESIRQGGEIARLRALVERTREEAAREIAAALEQIRSLQEASNRDRIQAIERHVLAGALGAAVGAIIVKAATPDGEHAGDKPSPDEG
jgi:hypothetical protein